MNVKMKSFLFGIFLFVSVAGVVSANGFHVIPFNVDPPITVDGDLSDWEMVPNPITIREKAQVVLGAGSWTGPEDLSGEVRLAWRNIGIFISARVADDMISVVTGRELWKGDHVALLMDMIPGVDAKRTAFGKGQFQLGISPGSLNPDGSGAQPEIVIWKPAGATSKNSKVIAKKTAEGYLIEAFIPWSSLNVDGVKRNLDANFEFALSDCDALEPKQETWMTVDTNKWRFARPRLNPVVFGDGNGKGEAPVRSIVLSKNANIQRQDSCSFTFDAPDVPEGKVPFVFFNTHFNFYKVAGCSTRALQVEVNGKAIDGTRLANRPPKSLLMNGKEATFVTPDGAITVPFAPTSTAYDKHPTYRIIDGTKACDYEFDLSGLLNEGENTITFRNLVPINRKETVKGQYLALLENVQLRLKAKGQAEEALKPAPTGPLTTCEPRKDFPKSWSDLESKQGEFSLTVNEERFTVTSSFTAPDGKKYNGSSPFYTHTREIVERGEWIEVRDTFKNLTNKNVPIMQEYKADIGGKRRTDVYLSCLRIPAGQGRKSVPQNPSVYAETAQGGLGLLALNDVLRVHGDQMASPETISLRDNKFVLKAGGEYTAEWAVIPVDKPDLWAFVNAARRMTDANFTMKILSGFLFKGDPTYKWSDDMLRNFITHKSVTCVTKSLYCGTWKRRIPQGTAFHELLKEPKNRAFYTDAHDRVKELFPDGSVKLAVYYHCFIDVIDESMEKYKDARRLDAAGNQMTYSLDHYKMYVPTLENDFGKAIGKGIDIRLDELGADAFYWDEYNQSRGTYTYAPNMWDGCSADINPVTYKISRLKGAVHLLSLPFLKHHISRIQKRVPAYFNGAPFSRTLADLKMECFTETGSIGNCHRMVLYTPIALGDHITEKSEKDSYGTMIKALDWGCLYAWYSSLVIATHNTITEHMFPATPIELHEGYIICKERILTNRSGLFGWGGAEEFDIYVYDREGRLTDGKEAVKRVQDGKSYAEVRIPEGYSAAIVRK